MYPVEQFVVLVRSPSQYIDQIMPFMILFVFFVIIIMHCVTAYCLIALMQLITINLCIFIPVIRRVKGYTRFVGEYVTEGSVSDPIKCIYS